jgi:hypothetical protein
MILTACRMGCPKSIGAPDHHGSQVVPVDESIPSEALFQAACAFDLVSHECASPQELVEIALVRESLIDAIDHTSFYLAMLTVVADLLDA